MTFAIAVTAAFVLGVGVTCLLVAWSFAGYIERTLGACRAIQIMYSNASSSLLAACTDATVAMQSAADQLDYLVGEATEFTPADWEDHG